MWGAPGAGRHSAERLLESGIGRLRGGLGRASQRRRQRAPRSLERCSLSGSHAHQTCGRTQRVPPTSRGAEGSARRDPSWPLRAPRRGPRVPRRIIGLVQPAPRASKTKLPAVRRVQRRVALEFSRPTRRPTVMRSEHVHSRWTGHSLAKAWVTALQRLLPRFYPQAPSLCPPQARPGEGQARPGQGPFLCGRGSGQALP